MKRVLFLMAVILMTFSAINAQVELKLLVGTNFVSLDNPPPGSDYAAKAGFQYGGGLLIGDKFYVEPGVQFVRMSRAITETTTEEEIDFTQNFVKVPLYAGYHLLGHESGPVALRVFGGPAAIIAGKVKKGDEQITKDDVKNFQLMADVGVGVDILFLFAELNYELGLTKFWENEDFDSTHKGFVINAGIHLDF